MSRTLRPPHRIPGRCRPRLERLESRLALSASSGLAALDMIAITGLTSSFAASSTGTPGPNLTPVATEPAGGVTLTTPLTAITVTFDRPIDPASIGSNDVLIQTQQGGSWTSLYSIRDNNAPAESLDATETQLTLTLSKPLAPGNYRLLLPEVSLLSGQDFSFPADLGHDQVLATFTVSQPQANPLVGATVLAVPVSTPVSASGSLDLQNSPGAVDLYTFTLPAGHHWRLGAEIQAARIGSPLQATLSLFDGQGHLIQTANVGRPDAPSDPYLFAGLAPGTYYLGVSGHNNVPGTAAGYDPSTGQVASNLPAQSGGSYRLNVVADPADSPTRLLGSSLQYADPTDPHPTGLALAFSGPIALATLKGDPTAGIQVVNQDGKVFPITAVAQYEAAAQYFFLFDQDMPAGHYSVVVPDAAHGGLTDLAGDTPVAHGRAAGVLLTFDVHGKVGANPKDLGPLYHDVHTGITRTDVLAPGTGSTYRFVVTSAGTYYLSSQYDGGSLSIRAYGPGQSGTINAGQPGKPMSTEYYLDPGVYHVQFVNTGKTPIHLSWTLRANDSWESLLDNGLGQGPALNLRLINPTSSGLSQSSAPGSEGPSQPASAAPSLASQASSVGFTSSVAPGGVYFTLGNALVGRPSTQSEHVAAVGPATDSGSPALAASGSGLLQGIHYGTTPVSFTSSSGVVNPPAPSGRPATDPEPVNGALVAEATPTVSQSDEAAIAAADWIGRMGNVAARWMAAAPQEPTVAVPEVPAAAAPAEPIALARDDAPASSEGDDNVVHASLDGPIALGVAAVMSFRYHPPLLRWLKRNRTTEAPKRTAKGHSSPRGPHTRF